jgi:hypothetical protein
MGINVILKDESGGVLGSVLDPEVVLSRFSLSATARSSRILQFLDPAVNLILNRAQSSALLEDLSGIIPQADARVKLVLERVRELAEQCERGTHLYIWFVGD